MTRLHRECHGYLARPAEWGQYHQLWRNGSIDSRTRCICWRRLDCALQTRSSNCGHHSLLLARSKPTYGLPLVHLCQTLFLAHRWWTISVYAMCLPRFRVSLLIQFTLQTLLFIVYIPLLVIDSTAAIITLATLGIALDIIMRWVDLAMVAQVHAVNLHNADTLSGSIGCCFPIAIGILHHQKWITKRANPPRI